MGRVGVITHRERHDGGFNIVHIKDAIDNAFATRESNVFVIGSEKPWVSLPKGKGVYVLRIAEPYWDRKLTKIVQQIDDCRGAGPSPCACNCWALGCGEEIKRCGTDFRIESEVRPSLCSLRVALKQRTHLHVRKQWLEKCRVRPLLCFSSRHDSYRFDLVCLIERPTPLSIKMSGYACRITPNGHRLSAVEFLTCQLPLAMAAFSSSC